MKKVISVVIIVGALAQISNAMGPAGDTTHRHLYKDQEWIWQSQADQPKAEAAKDVINQASETHIWHLPIAFLVPTTPTKGSTAFMVPTHPDLAFMVPTHPGLAFMVPTHPDLAFMVPTHPDRAFTVPVKPSRF